MIRVNRGSPRLDISEAARDLYAAAANSRDVLPEKMAEILEKRVARFRRDASMAEESRLVREIQEAERTGDSSRVAVLQRKKIEVSRQRNLVSAP